MQDTKFKYGDRVELLSAEFGHLKEGSSGVVIEVYAALPPSGSLPFPPAPPTSETFDVAVVFPRLRGTTPPEGGPLKIPGLDTHNLHEGDVVPMKSAELKVTGNIYD